jgi:hypothetical protein
VKIRFNWQNLNEQPGNRFGSPLIEGRAWLDIGNLALHWSWALGRAFCHFGIATHEEHGWEFSLAIPPVAFWFTIDAPWIWKPTLTRQYSLPDMRGETYTVVDEREFKVSIHEWTVRFVLWGRQWDWNSKDPWWIKGVSVNLPDLLLGKAEYSNRPLGDTETVVSMPEGNYRARVEMFESTWKRPRWFAKRMVRATIHTPDGIPHPGKGENSWDCGENATYSLTCPAATVEEAIAAMVESVLRSRRRHGGSVNWEPGKERQVGWGMKR